MDRVGHRRAEKTLKRRSDQAKGSGHKIVVDEDGVENLHGGVDMVGHTPPRRKLKKFEKWGHWDRLECLSDKMLQGVGGPKVDDE